MSMEKKRCTAIVLAAGSGSRMKSGVAKQYMLLRGKPLTWYALRAVEDSAVIDDGGRPFLTEEILRRDYEAVERFRACVTGMPVKDTIKIADKEGYAARTPDRSLVWQIQTPQVFESALIIEAYEKLMQEKDRLAAAGIRITDDAMVVETLMDLPVRLVQGSYENIKITTPEDLAVAEAFLP